MRLWPFAGGIAVWLRGTLGRWPLVVGYVVSGLPLTDNPQLLLLDRCTVGPIGKFGVYIFGIYIFVLISIDLLAGTSYLR